MAFEVDRLNSKGTIRLLCCQVSLTATSLGSLLICCSLVISHLVFLLLPSGRVRFNWRLLLYLDHYGGTVPLGRFTLFLKRTAGVLAPRHCVMFRRLLRLGSFPACCRQANGTPIARSAFSSSVANYRRIFITPALPDVFKRLVSVGLGRFMERNGVLTTTQFAYQKCLGTRDTLLCVPVQHTEKCVIEWARGQDCADWFLPLIGSTFKVLYKLSSVGISGSLLSILKQ